MKWLSTLLVRFEHLDKGLNQWLVTNYRTLLRLFTGIAFLEFGLVKYLSGSGPLDELTDQVTYTITAGWLSSSTTTAITATLECVTGICFLSNRFLQLGIWILTVQLLSGIAPLLLFSSERLMGLSYAPSLVAQYLITEVILVAVGIFMAASWTKKQMAAETEPIRA